MHDLFVDSASLRDQYAATRWADTPLGPVEGWSASLRSAVDVVLHTRFPSTLLWGPDLVLVYNEAYVDLIGDKHPRALGSPAREIFPEAWDTIAPMLQGVLDGGPATWVEDSLLPLRRHGFLEDCWFTFSYSAVRGPDGAVEGVLDITAETTAQVVDRRRLALLARLTLALASVDDVAELPARAVEVLSTSEDLAAVELTVPGVDSRSWQADGDVEPGPWQSWRLPAAQAWSSPSRLRARASARLGPEADPEVFLGLVADAIALRINRLRLLDAERRAAEGERSIAEALQRSLLVAPLEPDHLQLAVRYVPAEAQHRLGGDWYDSFLMPDGALAVVVGDVAGHDQEAAVAMGQVRDLLRGVACTTGESPGAVLSGLDRAMTVLALDVLATAVMLRVEQTGAEAERGVRTVRWSNAGHLPPVLLRADGRTELLSTPPEVLLGLSLGRGRADHVVVLDPGDTLVLCTDGLVERRDRGLRQSLGVLRDAVGAGSGLGAEELCEHLLARLGPNPRDDIALVVLRAHPDDGPRPTEAGAQVLPADRTG